MRGEADATAAWERQFDWWVLDTQLQDGSAVTLAERAARLRPAPRVLVTSGSGHSWEAFRLAQLGARGCARHPIVVEDLARMLDELDATRPDVLPHLLAAVGHLSFREMLELVRRSMAEQALAMSGGNKTGAARLLGITRQAVQQLIRDLRLTDGSVPPLADDARPAGRERAPAVRPCH